MCVKIENITNIWLISLTVAIMFVRCARCCHFPDSGSSNCSSVSIYKGIPDSPAYYGTVFDFTLPRDAFVSDGGYVVYLETDSLKGFAAWLSYDVKTCSLSGTVPRMDRTRLAVDAVAQCPSCRGNACLTRDTFTIHFRYKPKGSRSYVNNHPPLLGHKPPHLHINVGEFYTHKIAPYTFTDEEDGDASNLWLSLTMKNGSQIPDNYWLWFTQETMTISLFPSVADYRKDDLELVLAARDYENLEIQTKLTITLDDSSVSGFSHSFRISFHDDDFVRSKILLDFFGRLSSFSNDKIDVNRVIVLAVTTPPVSVEFYVKSVPKDICDRVKIEEIHSLFVTNGSLNARFVDFMKPDFRVERVAMRLHGVCQARTRHDVTQSHNLATAIAIPIACVVLLIIVCVIAVCIIRCKKRRRRAARGDEGKEKIPSRAPVILPDDFHMIDVDYKGKKPTILIGECGQTQPVESVGDFHGDRPPPPEYHRGFRSHDASGDDSFGCHGNSESRDDSLPVYRTLPPYRYNPSVFTEL